MAMTRRQLDASRVWHDDVAWLDGIPLRHFGLYLESVSVGEAEPVASYADVPGRNGEMDLTLEDSVGAAFLRRRDIALTVFTVGTDDERRGTKMRLAKLRGKEVRLFYRRLGGTFKGRLAIGAWDDSRLRSVVEVTIHAEPHMLGREHTVKLKAGSNSFRVSGSRPACPTFELTPRSGAAYVRAVNSSTGEFIRVESSFTGNKALAIDCEASTCSIGGASSPVTLDSDYFALVPGDVELVLTNATSGTLKYTERWDV